MKASAYEAPRFLYHGTAATHFDSIMRDGIKPRGKDKARSNWTGTVPSNPKIVYLTDAFPLHFASQAMHTQGADAGAVFEIDRWRIDNTNLIADEDAVEQVMRGHDTLPNDWDMKRRTLYYRARAHQYRWEASMAILGTCGYRGAIPPSAITRAVVFGETDRTSLLHLTDVVLSIHAYRFVQKKYKAGIKWLFGDDIPADMIPQEFDYGGTKLFEFVLPSADERSAMIRRYIDNTTKEEVAA